MRLSRRDQTKKCTHRQSPPEVQWRCKTVPRDHEHAPSRYPWCPTGVAPASGRCVVGHSAVTPPPDSICNEPRTRIAASAVCIVAWAVCSTRRSRAWDHRPSSATGVGRHSAKGVRRAKTRCRPAESVHMRPVRALWPKPGTEHVWAHEPCTRGQCKASRLCVVDI